MDSHNIKSFTEDLKLLYDSQSLLLTLGISTSNFVDIELGLYRAVTSLVLGFGDIQRLAKSDALLEGIGTLN